MDLHGDLLRSFANSGKIQSAPLGLEDAKNHEDYFFIALRLCFIAVAFREVVLCVPLSLPAFVVVFSKPHHKVPGREELLGSGNPDR